ncbi:MAG: homospermidine synthase, partial [Elusimicrobia bacterium RIFCSPHIGHO2_02_FULL_61_10]
MKTAIFPGRILVLGCGSVSRCTLPLLLRHLQMPADRITVLDMMDCKHLISDAIAAGVRFVQEQIVQETMGKQLAAHVGSGDMIIDLAWNIGCLDLLSWCHDHGVLYINTSVELWNPYEEKERKEPTERTLYVRHMDVRALKRSWKEKGPTAILEHGANPGLVSHFTKTGLLDIAANVIRTKPDMVQREEIERAMSDQMFNHLAYLLGVRVIHISEIDTQVSSIAVPQDVFLNTWSVEGLYEEGTSPAELGWGTHERTLPIDACEHQNGAKNQICMKRFGIDTWVKSRVASREIEGMVVRHGEAFTISDALTVWEGDRAIYRPTVHYAYRPS